MIRRVVGVLPSLLVVAGAALAQGSVDAGRLALAAQPGYDGRQAYLDERDLLKKAGETWRLRQHRDAIALAEEFAAAHPYSARVQAMLDNFKTEMARSTRDREERSRYAKEANGHRARLRALMKSVSQGKRCESFDDDCRVIQIGEEQAFIEFSGVGPNTVESSERVVSPRGTAFDMLAVADGDGRKRTYYFDVSPFFKDCPQCGPKGATGGAAGKKE